MHAAVLAPRRRLRVVVRRTRPHVPAVRRGRGVVLQLLRVPRACSSLKHVYYRQCCKKLATLKKLQHAKHCALRVNISYPQKKECLEGEYLKFKAHIRGWKTMAQKERCKNVLSKVDHHLRQALLGTQWKDVLLVPQEWYPEYTPRYETKGWWYVPAEAVLGRACKSCNAFCELADFAGTKRQRTVSVICYKCNFEEDWTDTPVGVSKSRTPHAKGPHAKGPH